MTTQTKSLSIESKRAISLVHKFRTDNPSKMHKSPTVHNLIEYVYKNTSKTALNNYIKSAVNAGLLMQDHWYLESPTWKLTVEGTLQAELLPEVFRF
jgi:hypothetical protein